jgi:hypothetical protein
VTARTALRTVVVGLIDVAKEGGFEPGVFHRPNGNAARLQISIQQSAPRNTDQAVAALISLEISRAPINRFEGNFSFQQPQEVIMQILIIRHYGAGFRNSDCAVLLATGIWHHIVLLK